MKSDTSASDTQTVYTYYDTWMDWRGRYVPYFEKYTGDRYYPRDKYVENLYLIYKKTETPVVPEIEDDDEIEKPIRSKELENNGDGTYTITLSVKGRSMNSIKPDKKANVVIVVDESESMDSVRRSRARNAISTLGYQLLSNNTKVDDAVEIKFVTFATIVNHTTGTAITNTKDFDEELDNILIERKGDEGLTNWEAGLLAANKVDFGDDDQVYIIFVSDGHPTARINANGDTDYEKNITKEGKTYRYFRHETGETLAVDAAKKASKAITDANKKLYTVFSFYDPSWGADGKEYENNMKALFNGDTTAENNNFFKAEGEGIDNLKNAFNAVYTEITKDLTYSDVIINDGITGMTDSSLAVPLSEAPKKFIYKVYDEKGSDTSSEAQAELTKINVSTNKAEYNSTTKEVNWLIGGANYELKKDYTYSVSFVVWPSQDVYNNVANYSNTETTPTGDAAKENVQKNESGEWVYYTNNSAKVKYNIAKRKNGILVDDDNLKNKEAKFEQPEPMKISGTKLGVEKIWLMDDIDSQTTFITAPGIELSLYRGSDKYVDEIKVASPSTVERAKDESGNEIGVKWTNTNKDINLAPGILVSEVDKNNVTDIHGFEGNKTKLSYTHKVNGQNDTEYYYMLLDGYKYHFDEKTIGEGHDKFTIDTRDYRPMLVNGDLYDVEIDDETKKINKMTPMFETEDGVVKEKIKAYNELKFTDLTVYKKYTGNMAEPNKTANFELTLYKNASKEDYEIKNGKIKVIKEGTEGETTSSYIDLVNGKCNFSIETGALGSKKSITIRLPEDVYYEVKEDKSTSGPDYKTYCGTQEDVNMTSESISTGTLKLSDDSTIYFVNEKKAVSPTGIGDNAIPFVALALAGFGSLAFLAYDFRKRRLFED